MENVIEKQAVGIVESREREKHDGRRQRLQIIEIIIFMMVITGRACGAGTRIRNWKPGLRKSGMSDGWWGKHGKI